MESVENKEIDKLTYYNAEKHWEEFKKRVGNFEAWGKKNECCPWTSSLCDRGYGRFYMGTYNGKQVKIKTHRLAFYIHNNEELPKNLVLHKPVICHAPRCVNPLHLYDGTFQNNYDDMVKDGTSRRGTHHSEETKKKISEGVTGEKHPMFGKNHSEEAKKKISEAHKGDKNFFLW